MTNERRVLLLLALAACEREPRPPSRWVTPLPPVVSRPAPPAVTVHRPTAPLPPPGPGDAIGDAAPSLLLAAAEDGGWVVVCQARSDDDGDGRLAVGVGHHGDLYGDAMRPYLVRGGGPGITVDALVAVSRDDRWLVVERAGGLELLDLGAARSVPLEAAGARPDPESRPPRPAAFSDDSRFVAYFRDASVVVRELATARERAIAVPGLPGRVWPLPASPWARVEVVREDTDGNGRLEWPRVEGTAPTGAACVGPYQSQSIYGRSGDRPSFVWLRLDTGEVVDDPSVIVPVDGGHVRRTPAGAVVLAGTVLAPAGCAPEVFDILEHPLRLIASCTDDEGRRGPTELLGEGLRVELAFPRSVISNEGAYLADDELVCATPDVCYRPQDGRPVELGGSVARVDGGHVLLGKGVHEEHAIVDLATGARTPLPTVEGYLHAVAGPMLAIGEHVVDLQAGRLIGKAPRWPLAVDRLGRALIASGGEGEVGVVDGPLRWVTPAP